MSQTLNEPWYAVRCLFRDGHNQLYEERIVLINASSDEEAIEIAEKDAVEYAKTLNISYEGYADSFHLFGTEVGSLTELFSLMRSSKLDSQEYIDRFLDTGAEQRQK